MKIKLGEIQKQKNNYFCSRKTKKWKKGIKKHLTRDKSVWEKLTNRKVSQNRCHMHMILRQETSYHQKLQSYYKDIQRKQRNKQTWSKEFYVQQSFQLKDHA